MSKQTTSNSIPIDYPQNHGLYSKISLQLRTQLIQMVTKMGMSVYRASKILSINSSTAKVIIRNFRKYGHIYIRKSERNRESSIIGQLMRSANQERQVENQVVQSDSLAYPFLTHPSIYPTFDSMVNVCINPGLPVYYFSLIFVLPSAKVFDKNY